MGRPFEGKTKRLTKEKGFVFPTNVNIFKLRIND